MPSLVGSEMCIRDRSDFMAQSLFLSLDVCPGLGISPLRTNIWLSFCGLQSESRLPRRLCHAMPNHRPGEVNRKQQLPFCCRSPCESRDCCAAVAVPSGSELPSSLMLIQYFEVHNTSPNKSTASSNSKRSQRRRDDVRGTPTPLADDRVMRRLSDTDCSC